MPVQELIFSVVKNLDVPGLMRGVEVHGGADGAGRCGEGGAKLRNQGDVG